MFYMVMVVIVVVMVLVCLSFWLCITKINININLLYKPPHNGIFTGFGIALANIYPLPKSKALFH